MCHICNEKSNRNSYKDRKLKRKKKKCPENDEESTKPPKCRKPKRPSAKPIKSLTEIEKILLRIQPPIEDRERYLHPEHINCFLEESERVYIQKPECRPRPSKCPEIPLEDKKYKKKKNKKPDENNKQEKDEKEKIANDKDVETEAVKQEGEESIEKVEDEEKFEPKKRKDKSKRNKKKKNKKTQKHKKVVEEDSDSEMSIRSNDSEVCLVGLALTKEDREKIEENRRKVHPQYDNEENSVESNKNVEELSLEEGKR